jgi:hypothetical protein
MKRIVGVVAGIVVLIGAVFLRQTAFSSAVHTVDQHLPLPGSASQSSGIGSAARVLSVGDCVVFSTVVLIDEYSKEVLCTNPDAPFGDYYQVMSVHSPDEHIRFSDSPCRSPEATYRPAVVEYKPAPRTYCLAHKYVSQLPAPTPSMSDHDRMCAARTQPSVDCGGLPPANDYVPPGMDSQGRMTASPTPSPSESYPPTVGQ